MLYKSELKSDGQSLGTDVVSIRLPFLPSSLISVINLKRPMPYLSEEFCNLNDLLYITKKSKISLVFDVLDKDIPLFEKSGAHAVASVLYRCCRPVSSNFEVVTKSKLRRENRRRMKKLGEEHGEVVVETFEGADTPKSVINGLVRMLDQARTERNIKNRWALQEQRGTLEKVLAMPGSVIFTMYAGGELVSIAQCQLVGENEFIYMVPAFDISYSNYSPGMLLLEHIFKYCDERNLQLDFGKGEAGYKQHFELDSYSLNLLTVSNGFIARNISLIIAKLVMLLISVKRKR